MMKILKVSNNITITTKNGEVHTKKDCSIELYKKVVENSDNEKKVLQLLFPTIAEKLKEEEKSKLILEEGKMSNVLAVRNNSFFLPTISQLSLPKDFVVKILKAEKKGKKKKLQAYLNFWTLTSLNPDSNARENLFWFLNRYGMKISKSGLFVAYRNVVTKGFEKPVYSEEWDNLITSQIAKDNPDWYVGSNKQGRKFINPKKENFNMVLGKCKKLSRNVAKNTSNKIFTSQHDNTFIIKIGTSVSMPREDCDAVQTNTCSTGLHVGGKSWMKASYFGDTPIRVLINPANVVAVPPEDNYGKMRVSEYLPVEIVSFGKDGKIVDEGILDGFEEGYISQIIMEGKINNEQENKHQVIQPEINKENIQLKLEEIQKKLKAKLIQ